jgi:hypothetical protein
VDYYPHSQRAQTPNATRSNFASRFQLLPERSRYLLVESGGFRLASSGLDVIKSQLQP